MTIFHRFPILGLCLVASLLSAEDAALALVVPPDATELQREGRFSADHRFGWSASGASIRFSGSTAVDVVLRLSAGGRSVLQVVVDGEPTETIDVNREQTVYRLASGLDAGEHVIGFRKRPEGFVGELVFEGFRLEAGASVLPLTTPERRLLVIGDSISCGYGNRAADPKEGNTPQNQDGYLAYGPLAARMLDAEVMIVAWSGKGMYRNRDDANDRKETMPELFERTLPRNPQLRWDHAAWIPDVIVINLGTNDLARGRDKHKPELSKADYLTTYEAFLQRLRELPKAQILVAIGPMELEPISAWLPELAEAHERVDVLRFEPKRGPDYVGGHWHLSLAMHQIMAEALAARIRELTGWTAAEPGGN